MACYEKSEPKQDERGIHIVKSLAMDRRDWLPEKMDRSLSVSCPLWETFVVLQGRWDRLGPG